MPGGHSCRDAAAPRVVAGPATPLGALTRQRPRRHEMEHPRVRRDDPRLAQARLRRQNTRYNVPVTILRETRDTTSEPDADPLPTARQMDAPGWGAHGRIVL
jgi:hypothetical protein